MRNHTHARWLLATLAATLALAASGSAATYYVRADGGSTERCTGLVDAPAPGAGTAQPCAWDHPFRALPPGGPARIAGGDTLIVGAGSYRMGFGAPGADGCDAGGAFDCLMPPLPSGPGPASPTRILGAGWDSGCSSPPELWGAERPWFILNLTDTSNAEIACLEITDHSGCVEFHSGGLACEREDPPYGDWASYGLYAEDSANVHLQDLNIHGLAAGGVHAGRLTDWTVENVRVAGNGSVGWDGDLWDANGDSNSGTLTFRHLTVEWNGCGETYPGEQPTGCWAQSAGGYGDGFATGTSGGHWIVEDSVIRYNTSDGLDFLYISEPGSSIEIRRTLAEGNAGNQIKNYRGPFLLENSIIVGNCGFFEGQPFTYNVDPCRAMGDALDLGLMAGDQITVINNTITSEGDCLVGASFYDVSSSGTERVLLRNNIFQGQVDFLQPFENTCLAYQETFPADPFDMDYSIIIGTKNEPPCPGPHDLCGVSPGVVNAGIDTFDAHLLPGSPAINAGLAAGAPATDFDGLARDASPDIGAYEYGAAAGCTLSCSAAVPANAQVGSAVTFQGSATASGCSGVVSYDWDFGDLTPHASAPSVDHAYASAGTFTWRLTVTADDHSCVRTGTIAIGAGACAGPYALFIPAAAHTAGLNNTRWQSDLDLFNTGASAAAVDVALLLKDRANLDPLLAPVTVQPGRALRIGDILGTLLPASNAALGLRFCAGAALANLRFYNTGGQAGTQGMIVPSAGDAQALTTANRGVLHHISYSPSASTGFRVNIGFVNASPFAVTVVIRLYGDAGELIGTRSQRLLPYEHKQLTRIHEMLGTGAVSSGSVTVEVTTAGGKVHGYAMLIDNVSGDPAYMVPDLVAR